MAKITISVTRALAELKMLDTQIKSAGAKPYVAMKTGIDAPAPVGFSGKTVAQVESMLKADFDQVRSRINRRHLIKAAIVKSNASTMVKLGGKEIPVAIAIEMKQSFASEEALLGSMLTHLQRTQMDIDRRNNELNIRIDNQVASALGADKKGKTEDDAYKAIATPMKNKDFSAIIDPNNLIEHCRSEMDRLSAFKTEVDFTLSEINAKTEIEIDDGVAESAKPAAEKPAESEEPKA